MVSDEYKKIIAAIVNDFIQKENSGKSLPINDIIFTSDLMNDILRKDIDFDKNCNLTFSGYTILCSDNTITILIDSNGLTKNFFWIETLVHELTHAKDYCDYMQILQYENIKAMKNHRPLYFWTEFHAEYKGFDYMLPYVLKLPKEYIRQYIEDTEKRIEDFVNIKEKQYSCDEKIYYTMHLIGEILAYENLSINLDETLQRAITKKFDWFSEAKEFLKNHKESITISEMLLLSMNMQKIFDEQEV